MPEWPRDAPRRGRACLRGELRGAPGEHVLLTLELSVHGRGH
jgi:hypothetical protein